MSLDEHLALVFLREDFTGGPPVLGAAPVPRAHISFASMIDAASATASLPHMNARSPVTCQSEDTGLYAGASELFRDADFYLAHLKPIQIAMVTASHYAPPEGRETISQKRSRLHREKRAVWEGKLPRTRTGLGKSDLKESKSGRIVSKKQSKAGTALMRELKKADKWSEPYE